MLASSNACSRSLQVRLTRNTRRVDGQCVEARLGIEARVRLFLEPLAVVGFAHASLIALPVEEWFSRALHRDLEPTPLRTATPTPRDRVSSRSDLVLSIPEDRVGVRHGRWPLAIRGSGCFENMLRCLERYG